MINECWAPSGKCIHSFNDSLMANSLVSFPPGWIYESRRQMDGVLIDLTAVTISPLLPPKRRCLPRRWWSEIDQGAWGELFLQMFEGIDGQGRPGASLSTVCRKCSICSLCLRTKKKSIYQTCVHSSYRRVAFIDKSHMFINPMVIYVHGHFHSEYFP